MEACELILNFLLLYVIGRLEMLSYRLGKLETAVKRLNCSIKQQEEVLEVK